MFFVLSLFTIANVLITLGLLKKGNLKLMKIENKDLIRIFALGFAGLIYIDYMYLQFQFNMGVVAYGGFLEIGQLKFILF